jgi:hypothetical protein
VRRGCLAAAVCSRATATKAIVLLAIRMVSVEYAQGGAEGRREGAVARTRCGREGRENCFGACGKKKQERNEAPRQVCARKKESYSAVWESDCAG